MFVNWFTSWKAYNLFIYHSASSHNNNIIWFCMIYFSERNMLPKLNIMQKRGSLPQNRTHTPTAAAVYVYEYTFWSEDSYILLWVEIYFLLSLSHTCKLLFFVCICIVFGIREVFLYFDILSAKRISNCRMGL